MKHFFAVLCECLLVLLRSEISHLSVTSMTGQAAIGDCTTQFLLGGFRSLFFFLFSKHLNGSFKNIIVFILSSSLPPISVKLPVFLCPVVSVVLCPAMFFYIYFLKLLNRSLAANSKSNRFSICLPKTVHFHLFAVLSHFRYSVFHPQAEPLCVLGVDAADREADDDTARWK